MREESMIETRLALLDAGAAAFAEGGLDGPSLDSICERAGFTRGAFYVHFRDRQDFIAAVMDRLTAGFMETMFGGPERPADLAALVSRFAQAVSTGAYPIAGSVRLHQVLEACSRSDEVRSRRAELYREAMNVVGRYAAESQTKGAVRADVDAGQVGALLVAIVVGLEVLTELRVPFGASGAAGTVMDLLRPAQAPSSAQIAEGRARSGRQRPKR